MYNLGWMLHMGRSWLGGLFIQALSAFFNSIHLNYCILHLN